MSRLEAVLIFAGIPIGVSVIVAALVYAGSSTRRSKRYRPGRPFEFRPVWFLSAPQRLGEARPALPAGTPASAAGSGSPGTAPGELPAAAPPTGNGRTGHGEPAGRVDEWPAPGPAGANGGASDRW